MLGYRLGPVDKVDFKIRRSATQACVLGGYVGASRSIEYPGDGFTETRIPNFDIVRQICFLHVEHFKFSYQEIDDVPTSYY